MNALLNSAQSPSQLHDTRTATDKSDESKLKLHDFRFVHAIDVRTI